MGARLLLAEGKVQKSPEGVLHLMAEQSDRPQRRPAPSVRDEPTLPSPSHRHPRNVRILPPCRDFH